MPSPKMPIFLKAFFALYAGEIIFQCILGLKAEEERN